MILSFKQRCIALRKQDKSIIEIMKLTGRSKSSIYTHIHHIPLSAERVKAYRAASVAHLRKFAITRKGKSIRVSRTFDVWEPRTVRLVAHLLFDGGFSRGGCVYNNRSTALIERVRTLMETLYDFSPKE